jgi:hypothetical protein
MVKKKKVADVFLGQSGFSEETDFFLDTGMCSKFRKSENLRMTVQVILWSLSWPSLTSMWNA